MATVFRARQPRLRRLVAVKFLGALDAESRLRFVREARALAELEHPNIVRLFDANTAGQYPYIVMELVDGQTLRQLMEQGKVAAPRMCAIARQVAEALAFLHGRGIVHRDLKPANILLAHDGTAKVADFGLARCVEAGQTLTTEGHMVGTPHYLAPEILRFQRAAPSSDVYAMGVLLYQGLTGVYPFPCDDVRQLLMAHIEVPVPDPLERAPEIGEPLAELVRWMMAKDPAVRPPDGAALVEELDKVLDATGWGRPARRASKVQSRAAVSQPSRTLSEPSATARSSWSELSPRVRLGLAAALFLAIGVLGTLVAQVRRREPPPDPAPAVELVTPGSPASAAPATSAWSPEGVLAEPIEIHVPAGKKIPLNPVDSFTALPSDDLAAIGELSDQLRHTTICSGMTVYIPTNPLAVEFGLVEPPHGTAAFQLDLARTAHQALRIMIARRDALPIELTPSANRRRFTSDRVPVRRGMNKIFLVFLQDEGVREPVLIDSVAIRLSGAAPPPPDPVPAPLTPAATELLQALETARAAARWEEVAQVGEQLTRAAPQYGPGWWRRGDAHRRLERGDTRCGIELLDEAVKRLPSNPWVWHDLGCAYRCQSWLPEAAQALAYAARILPREFWIWYDLADVTWERGRGPDALAQLDAAAQCPGAAEFAPTAAVLRAEILVSRKDKDGALAALGRALAEHPADKPTRDALARLQAGDYTPRRPRLPR